MDLTKEYPRSVHEKMHGLVQIARTVDKGKATVDGNIGEYHYNCPMDQAVFGFLGMDHEALLDVIRTKKSDAEIDAYVKTFTDKKSPQAIEGWNSEYLTHAPEGESLVYFEKLRDGIAPGRTDITTWADLLDIDEKRTVPKRESVTA
ncbi:MAG: DUF5069 domain-containing protein [Candidatus Eremiobacteraeota bacterium]|nr:DUF5069 domain-containing protein [Candidatus Eremiobacteraeota bacterium]